MATTYFVPYLQDAEKLVTKAFPAAGASHNTDTIDLKAVQQNKAGNLMLKVVLPSCPNHTNPSYDNTVTLQHSTDDVTYADVSPLHQIKMAGVASTGYAGETAYICLPPVLNRYIQLTITNHASGGTNTAVSVVAGLVFGSP
jgi:hypothetical protein